MTITPEQIKTKRIIIEKAIRHTIQVFLAVSFGVGMAYLDRRWPGSAFAGLFTILAFDRMNQK